MTNNNYSALLDRIQREIPVEEITPENIARFLAGSDFRGRTTDRRKLGTQLAKIIQRERQIEISFIIGQELARRKRIRLSDRYVSNRYEKWGPKQKPAVVIFDKRGGSKIKAWRYIE